MKRARLVLASASPRRRTLLTEHGYEFTIAPADICEIAPAHFTPTEIVIWNARAKALAIALLHPQEIVLGVDTIVAFQGRIFGKPRDMGEAFVTVRTMAGQVHEVFSGVCLARLATNQEVTFAECTRVHFRALGDAGIRNYLARIDPLDKAGSYSAQDDAGELIERFEGSFTNVVGLPMEALEAALCSFA